MLNGRVGLVGLVGFVRLLKRQFPVEIIYINNHITWSGFAKNNRYHRIQTTIILNHEKI